MKQVIKSILKLGASVFTLLLFIGLNTSFAQSKSKAEISYRAHYGTRQKTLARCEPITFARSDKAAQNQAKACDSVLPAITEVNITDQETQTSKIENTVFAWLGESKESCALVSVETYYILKRVDTKLCNKVIFDRENGNEQLLHYEAKRAFTFRKILADPAKNQNMAAELGAACVQAINQITQAGGSLRSITLMNSTKPLEQIKFGANGGNPYFYHWTSRDGLHEMFELNRLSEDQVIERARANNTYEKMFDFLRARSADEYAFWRRVFYVAKDKASSAFLGTQLIEFELDLNAKTISYEHKIWQKAMDEVSASYPSLKQACAMDLDRQFPDTHGVVMSNNMFFIVAEDSGVEVIDYNQKELWFQILSSRPFKAIRKSQK